MLTLLTATGCRPEAWAICEQLMLKQDYQGRVKWIIVDDGEDPQPITFKRIGWELTILRPEKFWKPGQNTQSQNLKLGLTAVDDDAWLLIIEDDDYYSPDWLSKAARWLLNDDLVGESRAIYYNIAKRKYKIHNNTSHSSLCSTALKGQAIESFKNTLMHRKDLIDLYLWRNFNGKKSIYNSHSVIGIKGIPGRLGIGYGHRNDFNGQFDFNGSELRSFIGEGAEFYL